MPSPHGGLRCHAHYCTIPPGRETAETSKIRLLSAAEADQCMGTPTLEMTVMFSGNKQTFAGNSLRPVGSTWGNMQYGHGGQVQQRGPLDTVAANDCIT